MLLAQVARNLRFQKTTLTVLDVLLDPYQWKNHFAGGALQKELFPDLELSRHQEGLNCYNQIKKELIFSRDFVRELHRGKFIHISTLCALVAYVTAMFTSAHVRQDLSIEEEKDLRSSLLQEERRGQQ